MRNPVQISRKKMRGGSLKTEQDGEIDGGFVGNFFESLPEGFVANALALTTPRDVCRLSLVCCLFRSAAEWDAVWEKFLPEDYQKILGDAVDGGRSKKELYLRLCDHPLIIDGGKKSFWLDKVSGKKCYMMAARDLSIIWGGTPRYWRWIPLPESRFAEVAQLIDVCWLEVHGTINTSMLSKGTRYVAYLVYKLFTSDAYGIDSQPAQVSIRISEVESQTKAVFLDPDSCQRQQPGRQIDVPRARKDGWFEIELGEYFNATGDDGELKMSVKEIKGGNWKRGLVIQGMEIRSKAG